MNQIYPIQIEQQVVEATREQLEAFSHAELKRYAEGIGVKTAKTKAETIANLMESGKATLCVCLGD